MTTFDGGLQKYSECKNSSVQNELCTEILQIWIICLRFHCGKKNHRQRSTRFCSTRCFI